MIQSHTDRAHAIFAPSAANRWLVCPGSVVLDGVPVDDAPNAAATWGTICHEAAAAILEGHKFEKVTADLDDEQIQIVKTYVDFVYDKIEELEAKHDRVEVFIETSFVHPAIKDFGGTADVVIIANNKLIVIDLKTGYVPVKLRNNADEPNPQLMSYALLAWFSFFNSPLNKCEAWIVQPRVHDKPIRMEIKVNEFPDFNKRVYDAIKRVHDGDQTREAGEHCKYCHFKGSCKANYAWNVQNAKADFADPVQHVPEPSDFSETELSQVLEHVDELQTYIDGVRAHALRQLERGATISGFKLVPRRAVDKWIDPDKTKMVLSTEGLPHDKIFRYTLRTPKQIEEALAEHGSWVDLSSYHEKISSGNTIARIGDPRKEVKASAGDDFKDV